MRKKKSGSSFRSEKKKIDLSILPYKNSLLNFINKKCANTDFEQKIQTAVLLTRSKKLQLLMYLEMGHKD